MLVMMAIGAFQGVWWLPGILMGVMIGHHYTPIWIRFYVVGALIGATLGYVVYRCWRLD